MILVRWETTPDDIHGLIQARGVLTAHGGMTSHAAVVARGMGKPCVAGCEGLSIDAKAGVVHIGEHVRQGGGDDHDRRRHRARDRGPGAARAACDRRELRHHPGVGRRGAAPAGARQRRHAGGCGQGARVRGRGDRPLPHRAHVHGAGAAADRAGDDPRDRRGGPPCGAGQAAADAAVGLRGHLRGDGRLPGHDPAARPAPARVPALARGRHLGRDAAPYPRAARGQPDARHARLPARPAVARDLRDAGTRDRPRRPRRRGAHRRGTCRRDHASPCRLPRGVASAARADRARRGRGARPSPTAAAR